MALMYLKFREASIPFIFHGLLCVLAYIFWALCVTIMLPLFGAFQLYQLVEDKLLTSRKGDYMSSADSLFAFESTENPNFINVLITVKGEMNLESMKSLVINKLLGNNLNKMETYTRLRQRVAKKYNRYLWRDEENFHINDHVVLYKGTAPTTKDELEKCFSILCSKPFPRNMSPWQIIVIPLHDETEKYACHIRVHHCIGDGFALVGLFCNLVDERPKLLEPKKASAIMSNPIGRILRGAISGPLNLIVLALSQRFANPFAAKVTPTKKTASWTTPLDFELVRKIKTASGTAANDVIVSCVAGGLRRYLLDQQIEPEDQPITMTYNSRQISEMSVDHVPLGNQSGASFLKLAISIADPTKRLEVMNSRIAFQRKSSDPHLFSFIYFYIVGRLPHCIARFAAKCLRHHCTLILSNVPGPLQPMHIQGNRVESVLVIPPLVGDLGLTMAIFTYAGKMQLTVLSDETIVPEPWKITSAFEEELLELERLFCKKDI